MEKIPDNLATLRMKGIAYSNLGNHEESLRQFFMVLQYQPKDVISLTGMGAGFGNLGEYHEAKMYFEKALELNPKSRVIQNYKEFVDNIISKYPYTPTEKPQKNLGVNLVIPNWIKNISHWWAQDKIEDEEFIKGIHFL